MVRKTAGQGKLCGMVDCMVKYIVLEVKLVYLRCMLVEFLNYLINRSALKV